MKFELTCIIPSQIPAEKLSEIINQVKKAIGQREGEIISENVSEQKLAYPVKKHLQANYLTIDFSLEPAEKVNQLNKQLKLSDKIIRYFIVKKPLKPVKAEKRSRLKKAQPKPADKKEESKEKVKIEELDKKLEEILKEEKSNN